MKKLGWAALLGLATVGLPSAEAQFYYTRPLTNPLVGPNAYAPYYSLYGGARPLLPTGPIGGFGPGFGPGFGGVGGFGPGIGVPGGFGPGVAGAMVAPGVVAPVQPLDPSRAWVTGHPVGFMNHRGYFLNFNVIDPTALTTTPGASALPEQLPAAALGSGGGVITTSPAGRRPPRGRENLGPGR